MNYDPSFLLDSIHCLRVADDLRGDISAHLQHHSHPELTYEGEQRRGAREKSEREGAGERRWVVENPEREREEVGRWIARIESVRDGERDEGRDRGWEER